MNELEKKLALHLITLQVRLDTLETLVKGRLTPVEDKWLALVADDIEQVVKIVGDMQRGRARS